MPEHPPRVRPFNAVTARPWLARRFSNVFEFRTRKFQHGYDTVAFQHPNEKPLGGGSLCDFSCGRPYNDLIKKMCAMKIRKIWNNIWEANLCSLINHKVAQFILIYIGRRFYCWLVEPCKKSVSLCRSQPPPLSSLIFYNRPHKIILATDVTNIRPLVFCLWPKIAPHVYNRLCIQYMFVVFLLFLCKMVCFCVWKYLSKLRVLFRRPWRQFGRVWQFIVV